MHRRSNLCLCLAVVLSSSGAWVLARHFTLAFQRQLPAWENSAGTGCIGGHVCRVWVWDESGRPVPRIPLKTTWGILMGTTDGDGRAEIPINMGDDFDLVCADGLSTSDVTRLMTTERPECWGHYSFEVGFLFKTDRSNPGRFDLDLHGTWNEPAPAAQDNDVPYTRSLAYNGVDYRDYWSDQSYWGNWQNPPSYFGQTFIATGDRVISARVQGTIGGNNLLDWQLQIVTFPGLEAVGPATSVPIRWPFGWEACWGVNDCPVVPGQTYMLKAWRPNGGMNIYHVTRDVYPNGQYYEGSQAFPQFDMNGHVCCMFYEEPRRWGLAGLWTFDDDPLGADSSGQEHHGTIQGQPQRSDGGPRARALELDGDDALTIRGYKGVGGAAPRTCAAWVRVDPAVQSGVILRWGTVQPGALWQLKVMALGPAAVLRVATGEGYVYGGAALNTGLWTHLAVVLPDHADNTADLRLYFNGRREPPENLMVTSRRISTALQEDVQLGTNGSEFFHGGLDDIAIFDVALSDAQIVQLYTLGGRSFLQPCGHALFDAVIGRPGDIDRDCRITWMDLAHLAADWHGSGVLAGDVTLDGLADLADARALAGDWLVPVGLAAHWTFDQDAGNIALDSSANHYDARLVHMEDQDWVPGRQGQALAFDGVDEFAEVPGYAGVAGHHARTCSLWIRTSRAEGELLCWGDRDQPGHLWRIALVGGLPTVYARGGYMQDYRTVHSGQWVHIAAVLPDGGLGTQDLRLYVNGQAAAAGQCAIKPQEIATTTPGPVRLGTDQDRYFQGLLDDVRIYHRALSAEEIAALADRD